MLNGLKNKKVSSTLNQKGICRLYRSVKKGLAWIQIQFYDITIIDEQKSLHTKLEEKKARESQSRVSNLRL